MASGARWWLEARAPRASSRYTVGTAMIEQRPIRLSRRDILFEDDNYIAVYKQRGWPVHATRDPRRPNLFSALRSFLKHRDAKDEIYLALHHRLDVWTSGVVLFAKSKAANPVLAEAFRQRTIHKRYEAICVGSPPADAGELVDFLDQKTVGKVDRMVKVAKGGKKAITRYQVIEKLRDANGQDLHHVSFDLVTGRMHQVRVQCALAGFPILGDSLYGDARAQRQGLEGQLLHARRLQLADPLSGQEIVVEAPLPEELLRWLEPSAPPSTAQAAHRYILFHKPYGVLSQFTATSADERCLDAFGLPPRVYPVGRLDKDSEGLLLLTDDGPAQHDLADPANQKEKTYWVQVEGAPDAGALQRLAAGVVIRDYRSRPCRVRVLDEPAGGPVTRIGERVPPIRERASIPTTWLEIVITEGKNRQVRRMTAAVGHPTLRLVRVAVEGLVLDDLEPGQWREVSGFGPSPTARSSARR